MTPARPGRGELLALLLGAALSIFVQGFSLPNNGNAYHYPIVLGWIGSAEGPHDAFTQSLALYVTHFWTLVGWLVDEESLGGVFLALHLAFRVMAVLALRAILLRLTDCEPAQATLGAFVLPLLLFRQLSSPLGQGEVLLDSLSHSSAIVSFVLCGWALALGGRLRWAALLLGLAFNVKNFTALWAGVTLAGAALASRRAGTWPQLRELLLLGLLFLLGALPTLIWTLQSWSELTRTADGGSFDQRPFLLEFWPGHTLVWTHPPGAWLLGLLFAAGYPLLRRLGPWGSPAERRLDGIWLASLGIVLLALPLPLLTGNATLLNASPLRIDCFLVWIFAILLVARTLTIDTVGPTLPTLLLACLTLLTQSWTALFALLLLAQPTERQGRALLLLGAGAGLVLLWNALPSGGVQLGRRFDLAWVGLFIAALPWAPSPQPQRLARLALLGWLAMLDYLASHGLVADPGVAGGGALLLLALPLRAGAREEPSRGDPWQLLAVAGGLGLLLAWLGANGAGRTALGLLAAAAILPPGFDLARPFMPPARRLPMGLALLVLLLAPPTLHLLRTGHLDRYDERALAFLEAQRWARANTPPDSLFLQPDEQLRPNLTPSFWTLSRRPAWVDWRMGAAVHWQPAFYPLWHERMAEVRALGDVASKLAYARAEGIAYLVLDAAEPLPADAPRPLYDDGFWRILPAR